MQPAFIARTRATMKFYVMTMEISLVMVTAWTTSIN